MNSDINDNNKKSARELKGEVMNDIRKLNKDFDQLKDHLTPGQLIDDVLFYRVERGPRASFDYLKANPIGTSFLALGTLLLMEDEGHRSYESIAREKTSAAVDSARSSMEGMRTMVEEVKSNIKSKLPGKKGDQVPPGLELGFTDGADTGPSAIDISGRSEELKGKAFVGVEGSCSKISSFKESLQEGYQSVKTMHPLTYVALGAGLGALTGATLPLMEKEKSFAEGMSDKMTQFNHELQDALNESANILKNDFLSDISRLDLKIFGRNRNEIQPGL